MCFVEVFTFDYQPASGPGRRTSHYSERKFQFDFFPAASYQVETTQTADSQNDDGPGEYHREHNRFDTPLQGMIQQSQQKLSCKNDSVIDQDAFENKGRIDYFFVTEIWRIVDGIIQNDRKNRNRY